MDENPMKILTKNEIETYLSSVQSSLSNKPVADTIINLFEDEDAQKVIKAIIEKCHGGEGKQVSLKALKDEQESLGIGEVNIKRLIECLCAFAVVGFVDLCFSGRDHHTFTDSMKAINENNSINEKELNRVNIILERSLETSILFNQLHSITSRKEEEFNKIIKKTVKELEKDVEDKISKAERDYLGKTTQMAGIVIAIFSLVGFNILNITNSEQIALRELIAINFTILFVVVTFFGCLRLFVLEKDTGEIIKGVKSVLLMGSIALIVASIAFIVRYSFVPSRIVSYITILMLSLITPSIYLCSIIRKKWKKKKN